MKDQRRDFRAYKKRKEPSANPLAKRQKKLFGYVAPDAAPKGVGATASTIVEDYASRVLEKCLKSAESERHKNLPDSLPNQVAFRAAYQKLEGFLSFQFFRRAHFIFTTNCELDQVARGYPNAARNIWAVYFVLMRTRSWRAVQSTYYISTRGPV